MYIVIILALNYLILLFSYDKLILVTKISIAYWHYDAVLNSYCELLDYYDFDVSNMCIDDNFKERIQKYRDDKYGGKMTKQAIHKKIA